MNDQNMATAAQEFLKRVDLKGAEVSAFAEVWNWLERKRQQPQLVQEKDAS